MTAFPNTISFCSAGGLGLQPLVWGRHSSTHRSARPPHLIPPCLPLPDPLPSPHSQLATQPHLMHARGHWTFLQGKRRGPVKNSLFLIKSACKYDSAPSAVFREGSGPLSLCTQEHSQAMRSEARQRLESTWGTFYFVFFRVSLPGVCRFQQSVPQEGRLGWSTFPGAQGGVSGVCVSRLCALTRTFSLGTCSVTPHDKSSSDNRAGGMSPGPGDSVLCGPTCLVPWNTA